MPRSKRSLSDARTLRAVAHPIRLSIIEQLTIHGAMTASQLGERLDESPANCSWHVRVLAEHGFVEEAAGGSGRQRPWQVTHLGMSWGEDGDGRTISGEEARAGLALSDVLLGREVERLRDSQARLLEDAPEWREAATVSQSMLWLTAAELDEVNNSVRDLLLARFERHEDAMLRPEGAQLCAFVAWGVPTYGLAEPTAAPARGGED
ncbi:MAG: helix-turn-helix domain-containing protein [Lapillicoccus sp.]